MTNPANYSTKNGVRIYERNGLEYISVTSVLKVIASDALT